VYIQFSVEIWLTKYELDADNARVYKERKPYGAAASKVLENKPIRSTAEVIDLLHISDAGLCQFPSPCLASACELNRVPELIDEQSIREARDLLGLKRHLSSTSQKKSKIFILYETELPRDPCVDRYSPCTPIPSPPIASYDPEITTESVTAAEKPSRKRQLSNAQGPSVALRRKQSSKPSNTTEQLVEGADKAIQKQTDALRLSARGRKKSQVLLEEEATQLELRASKPKPRGGSRRGKK
jgi:hypothetical protein